MAAYPNMSRSAARSYSTQLMQKDSIKKELKQVMAEQGLTLDTLIGETRELLARGKVDLEQQKVTPELYSKTLFKLLDYQLDDRLGNKTTLNLNIDYTTTPELLKHRAKLASFFNNIVEGETIVTKDSMESMDTPGTPPKENKKVE